MIETIDFGKIQWHHVSNPSEEDLLSLRDEYNFHELDIDDCRSLNQRPKIDSYPDYNFVILHFPCFEKFEQNLRTREVNFFWSKDYLISIGRSHWSVKSIFENTAKNQDFLSPFVQDSSDALLYSILNKLMADSYTILLKIDAEIELINRELFSNKSVKTIEKISITRKNIILLNTIFKPQLRLFRGFEIGIIKGFAPEEKHMDDYWGSLLDSYQKIWDMIEDNAEIIQGLSTTFDSLQTNRINAVMKIMTLISTIFLPLTFLTGLYGMNVKLPMMESRFAFAGLVLIMFSFVGCFILFAKKQKWL